MKDTEVPLYAIVELLIRISFYHHGLGSYHDYMLDDEQVIVTTTEGLLILTKEIVFKQVRSPGAISDVELLRCTFNFYKH